MALALTYLFVPGDRPDRFDKAAAAGADAVILDLEDAVAPEAKERAREAIGEWLTRHAEQLSRIYEAKIDRLNALKQSLLHRAFSGEPRYT